MTESSLAVALELEVAIMDERLPSAPERLRRDLDILLVNYPFCLACVTLQLLKFCELGHSTRCN